MSETSMGNYGIHLSLLDGMEEDLLLRLHNAGIATRDDLEAHIQSPESRRELARSLNVDADRIEAIHHLNFVFPTEQAARLFQAERDARETSGRIRSLEKRINVLLAALGITWVALLVIGWVWMQTQPASSSGAADARPTDAAGPATEQSTTTTRQREEPAVTISASEVQEQFETTLKQMGPAMGWSGPLDWDQAKHRAATSLSRNGDLPEEALTLSKALGSITAVEQLPDPAITLITRARAAASELAAFPLPGGKSKWSLGARQVWLRLHSLSQGLADPSDLNAAGIGSPPWDWTAKGFLEAEWRLARLHALPVERAALSQWSRELTRLQHAVNVGRDAVHPADEAWAREVWLPRAQIEFAVVGAMAGASTMAPYSNLSPKAFLDKKVAYVRRASQTAPESVSAAMAWLHLEAVEAQELVAWLEAHPDIRNRTQGKVWAEAVAVLDAERRLESNGPSKAVDGAMQEALARSGESGSDAWSSRRAVWEATMRPLLVETRAVLHRLQGS